MSTPHAYTTYPGSHPLEQAHNYYLANNAGYRNLPPDGQQRLARHLVINEQARRERLFLTGASAEDIAGANGALAQLKAKLEDEALAGLIVKAMEENPAACAALFEEYSKKTPPKVEKKDDPMGVAASSRAARGEQIKLYPGVNDVAKAIAMLSERQAGFKLQPWAEQNRIAGNWLATGSAT